MREICREKKFCAEKVARGKNEGGVKAVILIRLN